MLAIDLGGHIWRNQFIMELNCFLGHVDPIELLPTNYDKPFP